MSSIHWFVYICLQFFIFTIAIESWIYAQAMRGGMFAKPILNKEEEIKVINVNNFIALHFEDQTSYDEMPRSE